MVRLTGEKSDPNSREFTSMNKEDEEFLARVKKFAPEVLESDGVSETIFDKLTKALINSPPEPKRKRMARKRKNAKPP